VSEGNTDQAIALYMESGGLFAAPNQAAQTSEPAARAHPVNMEWQEPVEERAPIPVRQEQLLDHFHHDEFMMDNNLHGISRNVNEEVGTSRGHAFMVNSDQGKFCFSNPIEDEEDNKLSNLFKAPSQLIFKGHLDAARNHAKNSKKFLLVTIVDPGEFACLALNRDLWADEGIQFLGLKKDVRTLIKDSFVFLYLEADSSEGKRHSAFYPIDNYPYIAIVDPITGTF
jgi:hypothetical protein